MKLTPDQRIEVLEIVRAAFWELYMNINQLPEVENAADNVLVMLNNRIEIENEESET